MEMQDSKTGKWRRVVVNVSVCLLTSHPVPNVNSRVGRGYKMYKETLWHNVISNLKQFFG